MPGGGCWGREGGGEEGGEKREVKENNPRDIRGEGLGVDFRRMREEEGWREKEEEGEAARGEEKREGV